MEVEVIRSGRRSALVVLRVDAVVVRHPPLRQVTFTGVPVPARRSRPARRDANRTAYISRVSIDAGLADGVWTIRVELLAST